MKLFVEKLDAKLQGTRKVVIKTKRRDFSEGDIVKLINSDENKSCGAIIRRIEDGDGHISIDKCIQDYLNLKENDEIVVEKITPPKAKTIKLEGIGGIYDKENIGEITDEIKKALIGKPMNKGIEINEYGVIEHVKISGTIPDQIVIIVEATKFEVSETSEPTPSTQSIPLDLFGGEKVNEIVPVEKPDINFSNVGGLEEVKERFNKAIVEPLKKPEIYKKYGTKAGGGILLYGPPGCGKTFIVRAAAGECGVSVITKKISEILGKYVGESEKNIKAMFDAAKKYAPSILFIDEIDAIGGRRSDAKGYEKQLINSFLQEFGGFEGTKEAVLVIAATNEPWSVDPAIRRSGRFSTQILVPNPDEKARKQIFETYTTKHPDRKKMIAENVNIDVLVEKTEGYSSADIEKICEEAASIPRDEELEGKPERKIELHDFLKVLSECKTSLIPWFKLARRQIYESGEQDIFEELLDIINKYDVKKKVKLLDENTGRYIR